MQHAHLLKLDNLSRVTTTLRGLGYTVIALTILLSGCDSRVPPTGLTQSSDKESITLSLSCPDAKFAAAITQMAQVWASRMGSTVRVTTAPLGSDESIDIAVIPSRDLG